MGGEDSKGKGKEKDRTARSVSFCMEVGRKLGMSRTAFWGIPSSNSRNNVVSKTTEIPNFRALRTGSNQIPPAHCPGFLHRGLVFS